MSARWDSHHRTPSMNADIAAGLCLLVVTILGGLGMFLGTRL